VALLRSGRLSHNEREELAYLQQRISEPKVKEILQADLPCISASLFDRCVQSLTRSSSLSFRLKAGGELRRQLNSSARRPAGWDIFLKFWRRLDGGLQRRVFKTSTKKRFGNGGLMIAIVGGDGSGKTTAIEGLYKWLKEEFEIKRMHMGKPAWSRTTILVRGILKIGRSLGFYPFAREGYEYAINTDAPSFPGYPWLIREVCTARDRYLSYTRGRRFATNGGMVLCDRFPISAIKIMDGPQVRRVTKSIKSNRFIEYLARLEEKYYSQIMLPDLLMALRVDPEISVQRKTDESPESVRARAGEVWRADWAKTPAHMIDAGKSKSEVLSELKNLIWTHL
jgi:thymidylate kinase